MKITNKEIRQLYRYAVSFTEEPWCSMLDGDAPERKQIPRITMEDMEAMLLHLVVHPVSIGEFYGNWWYLMQEYFSSCMPKMTRAAEYMLEQTLPPRSEEEMLIWIFHQIDANRSLADYGPMENAEISQFIDFGEWLQMMRYVKENEGKAFEDQVFPPEFKMQFIQAWKEDSRLAEADEEVLRMFRRFVDDLEEEGDPDAIEIKGYACYGGNAAFDCDWAESARCMEYLVKAGRGYAANTLAYIHYYGRLTGKPDYEKAFLNYSIAAAYGIAQARYKIADMFWNGYYVAENRQLAERLIIELYSETKQAFLEGDRLNCFADVAYRMGSLSLSKTAAELDRPQETAYYFFLQAEYAMQPRLQAGTFGNEEAWQKIQKQLFETGGNVRKERSELRSSEPFLLLQMMEDAAYCQYGMQINRLREDNLLLTVTRLPFQRNPYAEKSMITIPEFSCCMETDRIRLIAEQAQIENDPALTDLVFDEYERNSDEQGIPVDIFFLNGKEVLRLKARSYLTRNPAPEALS